jgi:hypothetical protein
MIRVSQNELSHGTLTHSICASTSVVSGDSMKNTRSRMHNNDEDLNDDNLLNLGHGYQASIKA